MSPIPENVKGVYKETTHEGKETFPDHRFSSHFHAECDATVK